MNTSDKEIRAIFLNFKELRNLEKNCQSLDSEKSYYVSLINLDQKIVKVHYKRLKDKVSKIRSHLRQDELEHIKILDETGNLPKRPMSSKLDSNLRIEAAERRLKLMPRAKSAAPRLIRRPTTGYDKIQTQRSSRIVRTNTRPLTSPLSRSVTPAKPQVSARSTNSASCRSPRRYTPYRAISTEEEDYPSSPVPATLRRERKQSIYADSSDSNILSNSLLAKETGSKFENSLAVPLKSDSIVSRSSFSVNRNSRKVGSENSNGSHSVESNVEIKVEYVNDKHSVTGNKSNCTNTETSHNDDFVKSIQAESNVQRARSDTIGSNRKCSFSDQAGNKDNNFKSVQSSVDNGEEINIASSSLEMPPDTTIVINSITSSRPDIQVDTLAVPGTETLSVPITTSQRPKSVPATAITNFSSEQENKRPMTTSQRALETRNKSVMNIRRASAMLAEGKTRTPFTCHEKSVNDQKEKPFRSIRDGALACTDIDREILDSNLGDDLHKEIKKGMILGEVATSLYLEDKIDNFLDKVDTYVKENPNYTYDPDVTRAELIEKAREAKKKKPKRNVLRRRQLERRLEENSIEEMKKSRWLRVDDNELDTSCVNTLVVDQMKMLNQMKYSRDSD